MTTNDEPLKQNYDSNKEKSKIHSNIGSDLQRIRQEEIVFYNYMWYKQLIATHLANILDLLDDETLPWQIYPFLSHFSLHSRVSL